MDQSVLNDMRQTFDTRRQRMIQLLNDIPGISINEPKGAFYAIAQLPVDDADKFSQWLLEEFHLNGETVMLAPAAGFYATKNTGINQVRIAYVLNQKSLISSVNILAESLKLYPGRID